MNNMNQESEDSRGLKFEESEYQVSRSYYPRTSKIIQWVIAYSGGLIKDEKQANYAILIFVALAFIISLFLVFGGVGEEARFEAPPGYKMIYPENEPPRLKKL